MSSLIVGTAGHIDHGKSSLVEALTGTHPDRLKEEKARGITIDLGFAHTAIAGVAVAFVDVPGHERFVRTMVAGAGGIDAVMLIVAADESVMPQTREHFQICSLLGIDRGVIALTKIDRVDAETIALAALEIRDLVSGSFLDGAAILPVSARTGAGLDALRSALLALAGDKPRHARQGVVRLPVDRAFSMKGFGTVVTGTLVSGQVHEGDELVALPLGRSVRVRGVQVHGQGEIAVAAPSRVALNLGSVELSEMARGVTLATAETFPVTRRVDVWIQVIAGGRGVRHDGRLRAYQGTSEVTGRIALSAIRDGRDKPWRLLLPGVAAAAIPPGGEGFGRLRLESAMVLTRGDRLVLREITPASTIAGAVVLDPEPPATALRKAAALDRFQGLNDLSSADAAASALRIWLAESLELGTTLADAVRRGGQSVESASATLDRLVEEGEAVARDGRWFHMGAVGELERKIASALEQFHARRPADAGMSRETLREQTAPRGHHLFEVVINRMSDSGTLRDAERVALCSHDSSASDQDLQARNRIEELVRESGLGPADTETVRQQAGLAPEIFDQHVRELISGRRLARLGALLFHTEVLARLRNEIQELKCSAPPNVETWLDVATFKSRYGLSRKYAIPLLEWLDRERVTRRVGDRRLVLS